MEKILCVLACFDEETETRLSGWQKHLYEKGFIGTHTKGIPQHITLGTFHPRQEDGMISEISLAADGCPPFDIRFQHIGLFGGAKVLFIAPGSSTELIGLKERFGTDPAWTPHITMLMDHPPEVMRAVPYLVNEFSAFQGQVTSLALYEFWPARMIYQQGLCAGSYCP